MYESINKNQRFEVISVSRILQKIFVQNYTNSLNSRASQLFKTRRLVKVCAVTRRQQNQNAFPKMISVGDDRSTKSGKETGYLIFSISGDNFSHFSVVLLQFLLQFSN